jgi:hypothetical protein
MKNNNYFSNNNFNDYYTNLDEENILDLKNNYKILYVDYLDADLVHSIIQDKNEFLFRKKDIVVKMMKYYLNHKECEIYKKTDFLCNEKEKVCICNTNAADLRKIYDGVYNKPNKKYISWFKL